MTDQTSDARGRESSNWKATVVITTKDRPQLFEKALNSVGRQTLPCQVVVIDDGPEIADVKSICTASDGIVYRKNARPRGIIQARNQAFELAEGEFVFTLDDDAVFTGDDLVATVCDQFSCPYVGVVTIPLTDHLLSGESKNRLPKFPDRSEFYCVPVFSGGANAIRREIIEQLDGYRGSGRQGEERDFSVRMLELGFLVKVASGCKIDHYPQHAGGRPAGLFRHNVRANVEWAWRSIPLPQAIYRTLGTWLLHTYQLGWSRDFMDPHLGLVQGLWTATKTIRERQPVQRRTYAAFRQMAKRGFSKRDVYVEIAEAVGVPLRG